MSKLKIYVGYNPDVLEGHRLRIIDDGCWIDLRSNQDFEFSEEETGLTYALLGLGVRMKLPEGYEAIINPRSSSFSKFKFILSNSQGVIDTNYNGIDDEWMAGIIAFPGSKISKGDRILQFRIQLSQFATSKQKKEYLEYDGIEFINVPLEEWNKISDKSRGGFGSTGIK